MIRRIRYEWDALLTGVMFFTRIRVPKRIGVDPQMLNVAARYFPLIGLFVGGCGALATGAAAVIFPIQVAVLLGMLTTLWMTGAFHEDGLADMVDAFGGGYTRERTMEIMKDSRLGTFGSVALFFVLGLKWASLSGMHEITSLLIGIVVAHGWSRAVSISLVETLEYAREDADSKSKPLATRLGKRGLCFALSSGLLPMIAFSLWMQQPWILLAVPVTWLARQYLAWRFRVRLGGYTGDCLGATQQVSEVLCYLVWLAVFRNLS
jgi:adenosylcobinamide-GDP ribazoletransferase